MRGKKKPTAMHKLEGTYRPSRALPDEFTPEQLSDIPTCPENKEVGFGGVWQTVCENLKEVGMLSKVDLITVETYCNAVLMFRKACKELKEKGYTVTVANSRGSDYETVSPWVRIQAEANKVMMQTAKEFGFTPASRTKIPQPKVKVESPFEKLKKNVG
jgi:P27 family predicted phage terminase small subunit